MTEERLKYLEKTHNDIIELCEVKNEYTRLSNLGMAFCIIDNNIIVRSIEASLSEKFIKQLSDLLTGLPIELKIRSIIENFKLETFEAFLNKGYCNDNFVDEICMIEND